MGQSSSRGFPISYEPEEHETDIMENNNTHRLNYSKSSNSILSECIREFHIGYNAQKSFVSNGSTQNIGTQTESKNDTSYQTSSADLKEIKTALENMKKVNLELTKENEKFKDKLEELEIKQRMLEDSRANDRHVGRISQSYDKIMCNLRFDYIEKRIKTIEDKCPGSMGIKEVISDSQLKTERIFALRRTVRNLEKQVETLMADKKSLIRCNKAMNRKLDTLSTKGAQLQREQFNMRCALRQHGNLLNVTKTDLYVKHEKINKQYDAMKIKIESFEGQTNGKSQTPRPRSRSQESGGCVSRTPPPPPPPPPSMPPPPPPPPPPSPSTPPRRESPVVAGHRTLAAAAVNPTPSVIDGPPVTAQQLRSVVLRPVADRRAGPSPAVGSSSGSDAARPPRVTPDQLRSVSLRPAAERVLNERRTGQTYYEAMDAFPHSPDFVTYREAEDEWETGSVDEDVPRH